MRMDLLARGIQVMQILPGAAETEFSEVRFKGDTAAAAKVYEGFEPLRATDIAEALMFMVERPGRVCVQDLVITPSAQASSTMIRRG
jgi:NADP-dependent 3-hydroxy acid dehydrogenase YdfG